MLEFLKRRAASIADNILASLALAGGVAVIGWLAARSAYFEGLPLYKAILMGAGVFLAIAIGLYLLDLIVIRHRREAVSRAVGLRQIVPSKKSALAAAEQQHSLSGPEYTYSETWLQDIAERDRKQIEWAIYVLDCEFSGHLQSSTPNVQFKFKLFNGSVYAVSIDSNIRGYISYGTRRLKGEITLSSKWATHNMTPRYTWYSEIQLWLSEAADVQLLIEEAQTQTSQSYFNFEQLQIYVTGGDDFKDVAPKPLWLTNHLRGIGLDGRVRR